MMRLINLVKGGLVLFLVLVLLHYIYHIQTSTQSPKFILQVRQLVNCLQSLQDEKSLHLDKETTEICSNFKEVLKETNVSPSNEDFLRRDTEGHSGCYDNLEVSSDITFPFNNAQKARELYLKSFELCGHKPKPMSRVLFPVKDNMSLPVPNVIHYIWFYGKDQDEFEFTQYLSMFSVNKYMKPRYILWHGNMEPKGEWWEKTKNEIPNIYFVHWKPVTHIYGIWLHKSFFASDVLRMYILVVHGGIYIDQDLLVLKSFDPLRTHNLTVGRELRFTLANGVILAKPWSMFLRMWLELYRTFDSEVWSKTSMMAPNKLSTIYTDLIHIEGRNLIYPTWPDVIKLYHGSFDWSPNYSVHIFGEERFGHLLPKNVQQMNKANITLGAIMRHIYYGEAQLQK